VTSYLTVVYGGTAAARGEIRRLNALHREIRGPVRDPSAAARFGSSYTARDPGLSLWVHATLVDSTLVCHDAWIEPLSRERRAQFYLETLPIARAFGVPDALLPPHLAAFERYLDEMTAPDGPVQPSATARELARTILHPRLGHAIDFLPGAVRAPLAAVLDRVPSGLYDWSMWPAVGLLPPRVREDYGLEWGPLHEVVSGWLVAGWRFWRPLLPTGLRWMELSRAADRRIAAGE
jgi:uncharacterized protein (DUF2236 family)